MPDPSSAPLPVAVMMPVRQEGAQLRTVLDAVLAQDYPALEQVVIAVGPSDDETAAAVAEAAQADARVRVIDNPEGIVSTGLNRALQTISAPLVVRIDGHCVVPPSYVSDLVRTRAATGASCVGPRLATVGREPGQQAIASAMSSVFGVGNSRFRTGQRSGPTDTVAFGLYERELLLKIGGFRPELVRNQDDELNSRLRRNGGSVYLDADVCVDYHPRTTVRDLWRQYFEYGYWRAVTAREFDDPLRPRQLAPGGLVLGMALAAMTSAAGVRAPARLALGGYGTVLGLLAGQTLRRTGSPHVACRAAVAGAVLHLSYGSGLWLGVLRRPDLAPAHGAAPPLP